MDASNFILPRQLLEALGPASHGEDVGAILIDLAAIGKVQGFAYSIIDHRYIDYQPDDEQRISVDQWQRIVYQGRVSDVWTSGTVRLDSDAKNHLYYLEIIGIRFEEAAVRDALSDYGITLTKHAPKAANKGVEATSSLAAAANDEEAEVTGSSASSRKKANRKIADPIEGECLTIEQACAYTGYSRATIYKYIGLGDLQADGPTGGQRITKTELERWLKNAKQIARTRLDAAGNSR